MENSLHIVINSKGGVGKSSVSAVLAGYFGDLDKDITCFDADPTIKTFSTYKRFNANRLVGLIDDDDNEINSRAYDALVDDVVKNRKKIHIVDTGSSGFVSFINYIVGSGALDFISSSGKTIYFHIPIVGAQSQDQSIVGMETILLNIPDFVKVVIWLNEYNDKVNIDGVGFLKSSIHEKYKNRISAVITQEKMNANTFKADMTHMLKSHMSFAEAIVSPQFSSMAQIRLTKVREVLYAGLDRVFGLDSSVLTKQGSAS